LKTLYRAMRLRLYLNHGCGIETTILHEKHEHQGCGQTEPVACRRKWGILRIAKAYANRTDDEWMTSLLRSSSMAECREQALSGSLSIRLNVTMRRVVKASTGKLIMAPLSALVRYTDDLLNVTAFRDYCPNGLQIEGRQEVERIISGVTASRRLIEVACDRKADAVLVHHGFFWRGEQLTITGVKRERVRRLLANDISLLAYHLPLDAHHELGNNAQLANLLSFNIEGSLNPDDRAGIGLYGALSEPTSVDGMIRRLCTVLDREPLHIAGGPAAIRTVGWCTGAAQGMIERAVELALDAYISGEISEQTVHIAREAGIHYFAAGHHATERCGVKALGGHLAQRFGLQHQFIDIDNPV
jgi:dinuclear metal center YbgI/SA1388 family protein